MNGIIYTSWKDSLGVSHVDEPVATYENGKIYVAADGFFGTTRNGTLIGEYEDGKVYSIGTGAFNYGKRLNLVAIIEDGKIYSVQRSNLGGVSKSLSVGECSNGKVYSHSHKLMEGCESFGLYNGDEDGAAAAAAIALFKLKSDVSAYYDNKPAQDSSSSDDDLWEKYGLLMPIVVTYRIFKYLFIACKWVFKVIAGIIVYITKAIESKKENELKDNIASEKSFSNEDSEARSNDDVAENDLEKPNDISDTDIVDTSDQNTETQEVENESLPTQEKKKHTMKGKLFVTSILCLIVAATIILLIYNTTKTAYNVENAYFALVNKIIKVESTNSSHYRLIYHDENGREIKHEGYDSNGSLDWYGVLSYNNEGKIISWIDYDADNVILNRSEYMYDSNGKKIKELCFDENGELWVNIKYVYDGNKVTEIWCDQNWNPVGNNYYIEYYENGKAVRRETYNRDSDVLEKYEITKYNPSGVKIETTEYDASDSLLAVTKYTIIGENTKNGKSVLNDSDISEQLFGEWYAQKVVDNGVSYSYEYIKISYDFIDDNIVSYKYIEDVTKKNYSIVNDSEIVIKDKEQQDEQIIKIVETHDEVLLYEYSDEDTYIVYSKKKAIPKKLKYGVPKKYVRESNEGLDILSKEQAEKYCSLMGAQLEFVEVDKDDLFNKIAQGDIDFYIPVVRDEEGVDGVAYTRDYGTLYEDGKFITPLCVAYTEENVALGEGLTTVINWCEKELYVASLGEKYNVEVKEIFLD